MRAPYVHGKLDRTTQISGFSKLKLTSCATIGPAAQVRRCIMRSSGKSKFGFRPGEPRRVSSEDRSRLSRRDARSWTAARALRALHGSGGIIAPVHCFRIVKGTLTLLEALRLVRPKARFYNAVSSECFGNTNGQPADEATAFRPKSPYGVAKAAGGELPGILRSARLLGYPVQS